MRRAPRCWASRAWPSWYPRRWPASVRCCSRTTWFGVGTGLLAALFLALMPVGERLAQPQQHDRLDTGLHAAGGDVGGVQGHRAWLAWLVAPGPAIVGLGFEIKMLEAYLVVPELGLPYLLAAPRGWWLRIGQLALAGLVPPGCRSLGRSRLIWRLSARRAACARCATARGWAWLLAIALLAGGVLEDPLLVPYADGPYRWLAPLVLGLFLSSGAAGWGVDRATIHPACGSRPGASSRGSRCGRAAGRLCALGGDARARRRWRDAAVGDWSA
jgi:hypothetical protein